MLQWLSRLQEKCYAPKYLGSVKQDQDTSYLKFSPILRLSGHGGFAHASFFTGMILRYRKQSHDPNGFPLTLEISISKLVNFDQQYGDQAT